MDLKKAEAVVPPRSSLKSSNMDTSPRALVSTTTLKKAVTNSLAVTSSIAADRNSTIKVLEMVDKLLYLPDTTVQRIGRQIRSRTRAFVESIPFSFLIACLTVYVLFADDCKLAATNASADSTFDAITITCIAVFGLDILLQCIGQSDYLFGFYFFVDIVSTASLSLDLSDVLNALYASSATGGIGSGTGNKTFSQVGARAGRALRIIRLVRLVRVAKVYKMWMAKGTSGPDVDIGKIAPGLDSTESTTYTGDEEEVAVVDLSEESVKGPVESRVGKKLSELTTQKLCLLVLVLLLVVPQFTAGDMNATSIQMSTDTVTRSFAAFAALCSTAASPVITALQRRQYEYSLIETIYNHNWNAGAFEDPCNAGTCVSKYLTRLGWIGFVPGANMSDACAVEPRIIGLASNLTQLDSIYGNPNFMKFDGTMSTYTMAAISSQWNLSACEGQSGVPHNTFSAAIEPEIPCPNSLRATEKSFWYPWLRSDSDPAFIFLLDERANSKWSAILSICRTLFVAFVIGFGLYMFSRDTAIVIVGPIERMISKMKQIRENPLAATKLTDAECKRELEMRTEKEEWENKPAWQRVLRRLMGRGPRPEVDLDYESSSLETEELERTILKIGSLLVLGFGEAGTEVIGKNMQESEAGLNVMIPGRRVEAVFGYCSIRDFNVVTEVLQHKVMLFVNQIGELVHGIVDEFHGCPNKNLGSGFLLLWKLPSSGGIEIGSDEGSKRERICDLAVISFTKIIAAINRSPILAAYREHPNLMTKLPGYRVRLGMGMHLGWGIEGAVGSEFKIDASYLGPHVNVSQSLAVLASSAYNTTFLLSGRLVDSCSSFIQSVCRRVDRISFDKNVRNSFELFTIDCDSQNISVYKKNVNLTLFRKSNTSRLGQNFKDSVKRMSVGAMLRQTAMNQYKTKEDRRKRKDEKMHPAFNIRIMFMNSEMEQLREKYASSDGLLFKYLFEKGVLNYEAGEWDVAKAVLGRTLFFWKRRAIRRQKSVEAEAAATAAADDYEPQSIVSRRRRSSVTFGGASTSKNENSGIRRKSREVDFSPTNASAGTAGTPCADKSYSIPGRTVDEESGDECPFDRNNLPELVSFNEDGLIDGPSLALLRFMHGAEKQVEIDAEKIVGDKTPLATARAEVFKKKWKGIRFH